MRDPLDYRFPQTPNGITPRAGAARAIGTGAVILVGAALLLFLPLLWGEFAGNKYIVVVGLVAACVGLSIMAHAAWDWRRAR